VGKLIINARQRNSGAGDAMHETARPVTYLSISCNKSERRATWI